MGLDDAQRRPHRRQLRAQRRTPPNTSFRQRYLGIEPTSGLVAPAGVPTAGFERPAWPSCVFDGTDWNCSCPDDGAPALAAPAGAGIFPAFRIRFSRASRRRSPGSCGSKSTAAPGWTTTAWTSPRGRSAARAGRR